MSRYYDRQGRPTTREAWASAWGHSPEGRRVARDVLPHGVVVSTVWLGLDHSFGTGPPLIFETMVFGGPQDSRTERYTTEDQARAGHAAVVAEQPGPIRMRLHEVRQALVRRWST